MDIKKILSDTMIELLKNNTIDHITVKNVLEKSGVSRATFYKYFRDKMDLMMYPFFLFVEQNLKSSDAINQIDLHIRLFQFMKDNQKFFENAFKSQGQNSCEYELRGYGIELFKKSYSYLIGKDRAQLTAEEKYWIEFYSCGAHAVVKKWVESGMEEPPQVMGQLIYNCMPGKLRQRAGKVE